MSKSFRDQVRQLNIDLKRDIERMEIKERKTFHRATVMHDSTGKKHRQDRRAAKVALKRGDW